MTTEKDIFYEIGDYWVLQNKQGFHVMVAGVTHSTSESSYDIPNLAKARADYLAKHRPNPNRYTEAV